MFKTVSSIVISSSLGILLSGCMGGQNLQPKTYHIKSESKNYVFIKKDPIDNQVITKQDVNDKLKEQLSYKLGINKDRIKVNKNDIDIKFIKSTIFCKSEVTAKRKFSISENKDSIILTLNKPKTVNFSKGSYWQNLAKKRPCMPFYDNEKKALKKISDLPKRITIFKKSHKISGEVTSKYSMNTLNAMLKRELYPVTLAGYKSEYVTSDNIKNKFRLDKKWATFDGEEKRVFIDMYPYKNGTKINYEIDFIYNIDSSAKPLLTKSIIEDSKNKLIKILTD